jgi:hypothetical protein
MKNTDEIHKAGDWEIIHALHIGDKEVIFGENTTNPRMERYMCAYCRSDDLFQEYSECMGGDDYLEIFRFMLSASRARLRRSKPKLQVLLYRQRPSQPPNAIQTICPRASTA